MAANGYKSTGVAKKVNLAIKSNCTPEGRCRTESHNERLQSSTVVNESTHQSMVKKIHHAKSTAH